MSVFLRLLKRPYVLVNNDGSGSQDAYDLMGSLHSLYSFRTSNITPTNPILYERLSVVMSDTPLSERSNVFALLNPFSQVVWLAVLLLIAVKSVYSAVLTKSKYPGLFGRLRFFRPSFSATLVPIAFGIVLLSALYRNKLLASFFVHNTVYLISNVADLAYLSDDTKIYVSFGSVWPAIMHSTSADIYEHLAKKQIILMPGDHAAFKDYILREIQVGIGVELEIAWIQVYSPYSVMTHLHLALYVLCQTGQAVLVAPDMTAVFIVNQFAECGIRFATLTELGFMKVGLGVSKMADPRLLEDINRAIITLRGLLNGIPLWYQKYRPAWQPGSFDQRTHFAL